MKKYKYILLLILFLIMNNFILVLVLKVLEIKYNEFFNIVDYFIYFIKVVLFWNIFILCIFVFKNVLIIFLGIVMKKLENVFSGISVFRFILRKSCRSGRNVLSFGYNKLNGFGINIFMVIRTLNNWWRNWLMLRILSLWLVLYRGWFLEFLFYIWSGKVFFRIY